MKNRILKSVLSALVLISTIISCSTKEEKGYTIKGKFTDIKNGTVYFDLQGGIIDSAKIVDGNFEFKGIAKEPGICTISLKESENVAVILLDNENITFTAKKDSLDFAKISGAVQDSIYKSFIQNEFEEIQNNGMLLYKFEDSITKEGEEKLTLEQKKMLDERYADFETLIYNLTIEFVKKHNDKLGSALIIERYVASKGTLEQLQEYYDILTPELQKSINGKKIAAVIERRKNTLKGKIAPEFSQPDANGKIVKLSDYKGKYVLIDFWASWCAPCRKENPNLVALYKTYNKKGFNIFGVSLDADKDKWQKAIEKDGLTWTNVSDLKHGNEAATLYDVRSIPTNYLLDPDGKIIAKNLYGEELRAKLEEVFSKL